MPSHIKNHQSLKETFKEKPNLFSGEHQMFFGDKFQNYVFKTFKTRQKSEELFNSMNKGKLQLFRQALYRKKKKPVKGASILWEDQVWIAELHQPTFPPEVLHVKVYQKKELFFNMFPELIPLNQGKINFVVQGIISQDTLPKVILAGRSEHFL